MAAKERKPNSISREHNLNNNRAAETVDIKRNRNSSDLTNIQKRESEYPGVSLQLTGKVTAAPRSRQHSLTSSSSKQLHYTGTARTQVKMNPLIASLSVVFAACLVNGAPTGDEIVAFSAGLTNTVSLSSGETIQFDKVFSNVGGGYDVSTGVFTAPKNGIYAFTIHGYDANSDKAMWIELKKNDDLLVSISGYNSHSSAGNSVITYLSGGENVHVQARPNQSFSLFGRVDQVYATFSGYMIGQMDRSQSDSFNIFQNFPAAGR
ncbi:cerebellin-2-like [Ylistrum balloti]|uniref:cerebellin-2-like n=1 Tax=Ylistrum balloti TaxID=509963 RepID=UPI002905E84B|nr:cerebellin-2-like [Ylistrum balloti]